MQTLMSTRLCRLCDDASQVGGIAAWSKRKISNEGIYNHVALAKGDRVRSPAKSIMPAPREIYLLSTIACHHAFTAHILVVPRM